MPMCIILCVYIIYYMHIKYADISVHTSVHLKINFPLLYDTYSLRSNRPITVSMEQSIRLCHVALCVLLIGSLIIDQVARSIANFLMRN